MRSSAVRSRGFSLIELLIVMVIIAILVLIAIPAISNYRANARIAAVQSDLRNAATAVESSYLTTGAYPAVGAASSTYARTSTGVTLAVAVSSGDSICINGQHDGVSSGDNFYYASYDGAGSASGVTVERGVHSGSCGVGTTSGGTLTADGGASVPAAPAGVTASSAVTRLGSTNLGIVGSIAAAADSTPYTTSYASTVGVARYTGTAWSSVTNSQAYGSTFFIGSTHYATEYNSAWVDVISGNSYTRTFHTQTATTGFNNIVSATAANGMIYALTSLNVIQIDPATGTKTVVAGKDGGSTTIGGAATNYRLTSPSAVAVDSSGNIYIAETGTGGTGGSNGRVVKVDAVTKNTSVLASALANPSSLAVAPSGVVYVGENSNSAGNVAAVAADGTVTRLMASGGAFTVGATLATTTMNNVIGVAVAPNGSLLIANNTYSISAK